MPVPSTSTDDTHAATQTSGDQTPESLNYTPSDGSGEPLVEQSTPAVPTTPEAPEGGMTMAAGPAEGAGETAGPVASLDDPAQAVDPAEADSDGAMTMAAGPAEGAGGTGGPVASIGPTHDEQMEAKGRQEQWVEDHEPVSGSLPRDLEPGEVAHIVADPDGYMDEQLWNIAEPIINDAVEAWQASNANPAIDPPEADGGVLDRPGLDRPRTA